jgi:hypothetical protein
MRGMADQGFGEGKYSGDGFTIFKLAVGTGILTLLTLGIYRFWAKTRIRKYIWSQASMDGAAFEYTGTGMEKFLGFLVAVVVLAVYLAVVQLILFSLGMRFVMQPKTPQEVLAQLALIYSTLFAVAPLMFFAGYRSRRYKMARTRYRGIRFGVEKAAWGYTWRACLYTVLSIITLGILQPLMRFRLEEYVTERSWYGDARLEQRGKWTALYGCMKHIAIGVVIGVLGGGVAMAAGAAVLTPLIVVVGYVWLLVGIISYWVQGTAYLTRNKVLRLADGAEVGFGMQMQTSTIVGYYILGGIMVSIIVGVIGLLLGLIGAGMHGAMMAHPAVLAIGGAVAYIALLMLISALNLALIQQPVLGYMIRSTSLRGTGALGAVRQRGGEAGADADGFAEALDVGGAF